MLASLILMSRYHGNDETCPTCGLAYRDFRTGLTYHEVYESLKDNSDDPEDWTNKSRHTVLGRWHETKRMWWAYHVETCSDQADHSDHGDALVPPGVEYQPDAALLF